MEAYSDALGRVMFWFLYGCIDCLAVCSVARELHTCAACGRKKGGERGCRIAAQGTEENNNTDERGISLSATGA